MVSNKIIKGKFIFWDTQRKTGNQYGNVIGKDGKQYFVHQSRVLDGAEPHIHDECTIYGYLENDAGRKASLVVLNR